MDLRVRVHDIIENRPRHYQGSVSLKNMEQLVAVVGDQSQEISYILHLSRSNHYLFIKGRLEGELTFHCDRCLEPFQNFQQEQLELTLVPAETQNKQVKDQVVSSDELELRVYQGEWLDFLEILEEQLLLAIPMKKVCSESCQGICLQCGSNLNMQACACPPVDNAGHPFAGLI